LSEIYYYTEDAVAIELEPISVIHPHKKAVPTALSAVSLEDYWFAIAAKNKLSHCPDNRVPITGFYSFFSPICSHPESMVILFCVRQPFHKRYQGLWQSPDF
jgi:hypothetical protein